MRLQELEAERRSGRPKSKEQLDLEEHKRKDKREWTTGFGVFWSMTDRPSASVLILSRGS